MSFDKNRIEIMGAHAHSLSMSETIELINQRLENRQFTQHVVVNVAKIIQMRSDCELASSVNSCDIVNIDGMGVVWGARILGYRVKERVAGIDLFIKLVEKAKEKKYPIYLLGAKEEVVAKVAEKLNILYPGVKISGWHHGYFWNNEAAVVERIRTSGARLLFVAITSPKKENFINKWKNQLGVDFVMGVGGSFDVVAGKVKRAPRWMQRSGLEWFYRTLQEPRRMWRRYLVTNTLFLAFLVKSLLKR